MRDKLTLMVLATALMAGAGHAQRPLVLDDNLRVLNASKPDQKYEFLGSNAPGQLLLPGEKASLKFRFAKGDDAGTVKDFRIEIQEITTRDPDAAAKGGSTDTSGQAPLIGLEGKPISVPLTVNFTDAPNAEVEVANFPVPAKFGTYALILVRGTARQFLGTVARVPDPNPAGTVESVPIFGEGVLIDEAGNRADYYQRMGVRGWRAELSWNEKEDGTVDWSRYDKLFAAAKQAGCQVMVTLGGHPEWTRPFKSPTPAARWTIGSHGYGGSGDWLAKPSLNDRYGRWLDAFLARYWDGGKGGLWGLENYNEPWEGGGISGWASDARRYRDLQKVIATAAHKMQPKVPVLAASSIMNTEDKLFSDGTESMSPYIDIFTDHYVPPAMMYGPMVAKAHGKTSMETETWFVNSEYSLPQGVVQFLAGGQQRISPWHPRVLFDTVPGSPKYFIPTPVTVATAAFNKLLTGKPFEKMVFTNTLPFAFQFGADKDNDGLVVLFGRLNPIASNSFRSQIWSQVNGTAGGTITIDNRDGALQFFDLAGNEILKKSRSVTLPLTFLPTYIKSRQGPSVITQRLKTAKIEGKTGLEIIPQDFDALPNAPGATLRVQLRNRLNRPVSGTLNVQPPAGFQLAANAMAVKLAPGESKVLSFPVAQAQLTEANSYPFTFDYDGDQGKAHYQETLNAAVAPKGSKVIDGNLDDWASVPGVTIIGTQKKEDISEQLRRPWLEIQSANPTATLGQMKMSWDDNFLYVAARVSDPTEEANAFRFSERDEDSYFHSAASDTVTPYKEFIEDFRKKTGDPTRSFAEVPHVYRRNPEAGIPFRRDRLQFALDTSPGWHDMKPATVVADGYHAEPDTDYEYSLYWVNDGKNGGGELWRHLAPGVPRINDFPHQVKGERTTGTVPGAQVAVKRLENGYVYEAAIPRSELAELKLLPGTTFGFTFEVGNSKGNNAYYGDDKASTKSNGLTLHPYWEVSPNCGTRWTLTP